MATLLVKHLPSVLSDDSITEFFQHYGAIDVKIMQGKMKGSVYVTCKDPEEAKRVLIQLQGLKFLDKTLTAEVAKEKQAESTTEAATPIVPTKQEPEVINDDKQHFDPIAPTLGINYPSNPLLEYRYPNPNPLILTNILNAMTARPKFYTQVLHLMNKMNLPPPFGPPAPALPMQPEGMKRKRDNDVEEEEESEEEEELEDFPPAKKGATVPQGAPGGAPIPGGASNASSSAAIAQKLIQQQQQQLQEQLLLQQQQQQQQTQQQQQQHQHLQQLQQQLQQQTQQLQQQAQTLAFNPAAFNTPLPTPSPLPIPGVPGMPAAAGSKKAPAIQIVLKPDNAATPVPFLLPSQQQQQQQLQLQQQQQQIQATQQQIQQQQQLLQQQQQLLQQLNPTPLSKYVTAEELEQGRVSLAEIKEIDKKYEKGEPSVKLYIKNLNHKMVEVSDLERIFGKFFNNEQAMKDGLDIKLMKEGRMRGQAFVTFQDEELAEEAMEEVNGFKLHDKPMIIQYGKVK